MKLLVVVINNPDLVPEVVPILVELDVRGVTALESESVMQYLAQELQIFAGLRDLISSPKSYNKTIFGVTEDDFILDDLYKMLKDIDVDLRQEGAGYAFTLPIEGIVETPE